LSGDLIDISFGLLGMNGFAMLLGMVNLGNYSFNFLVFDANNKKAKTSSYQNLNDLERFVIVSFSLSFTLLSRGFI
jgi:hypothetical protein